MKMPKKYIERFWKYVNAAGPNECWEWLGSKSPRHLYVGTQKQNIHDRNIRNRWSPSKGESHYLAKLTSEMAMKIRKWSMKGKSCASIHRHLISHYGIKMHYHAVYDVVINKTWIPVATDSTS